MKRFFAIIFLLLGIISFYSTPAQAKASVYVDLGGYSPIYGLGYISTFVPMVNYVPRWHSDPVQWVDPTLNAQLAEYAEQKRLAREYLKAQIFGQQAPRVPTGVIEYPEVESASPL